MRICKNSYFYKRIKAKFHSFLINETTPPPILYFLIFAYSHYPFEPIPASFGLLFFGIATKILIVSNFNILFMMAPFLSTSLIMAVPVFITILLACNEKWKLYLFIFSIGDNIFAET
jgi:hypothetical protein